MSYADIVNLWDEKRGTVQNGISYGKEMELETGYGTIIEDSDDSDNIDGLP